VNRLSKENESLTREVNALKANKGRKVSKDYHHSDEHAYPSKRAQYSHHHEKQYASRAAPTLAQKSQSREGTLDVLEKRVVALEQKSHEEITPYVRYDFAISNAVQNAYGGGPAHKYNQPNLDNVVYPLSVGVGLRLTSSIRSDITLDYYSKNLAVPVSRQVVRKSELSNIAVLANAYYDFPSINRFTPYLGAGLGFSYFWSDNQAAGVQGYGVGSLAGAAMAGVNVELWRGLSADIGYRYAHLGFYNYVNEDSNDIADWEVPHLIRFQRHDFRLGLRYEF
jgi:opacity protein-like surface antigen